jgi:hypothetical protein
MDNSSLIASQTTKTITINGQHFPVIVCAPGANTHVARPRQRRRDTVGVYMPNGGKPEDFRLTIELARDMRDLGLCDFINCRRDVRLRKVAVFEIGAATIKCSEMETNAGLNGWSRTASMTESERKQNFDPRAGICRVVEEDFVERTQAKVRLWPLINDNRAPRVGPRYTGKTK